MLVPSVSVHLRQGAACQHACHLQVTYKRLQDTLSVLSKPGGSAGSEQLPGLALVDVMFGSRQPQFAATAPKWKANNTRLDDSQVSQHRYCTAAQCTQAAAVLQQSVTCSQAVAVWLQPCGGLAACVYCMYVSKLLVLCGGLHVETFMCCCTYTYRYLLSA